MGNLNDYALPQLKRILLDTTNTNDSTYLPLLSQAAHDVDSKLSTGVEVVVTGSSYALTPAPAAASNIWNVYAYRAVYLLRQDIYRKFLADMEGLASIRDEVTTIGRGETMRQLRADVAEAKSEYNIALVGFRRNDADSIAAMEETALRE